MNNINAGKLLAAITFIIVFVLGKINNISTSGANAVFLALIVGDVFKELKNSTSKLEKYSNYLIFFGGIVLLIANIFDFI
ncbi:hypothetical protein KQI68_01835 [Peptoniphilus sp. MSJ-1]|uniref:Uncharacterized protein n=1 Tax=Peptoniphilus ovalis TaxID=2841503 RepID=A0ABS6FEG3_9FIRM|nr:hypothetical protein [Peptoniphilus ovalis]MBU5668574.1 hypothetical protein [Peptoniphilus ovalis]